MEIRESIYAELTGNLGHLLSYAAAGSRPGIGHESMDTLFRRISTEAYLRALKDLPDFESIAEADYITGIYAALMTPPAAATPVNQKFAYLNNLILRFRSFVLQGRLDADLLLLFADAATAETIQTWIASPRANRATA